LDIDSPENEELINTYKVENIPTVIYVKADKEDQDENLTHGEEELETIQKNIEENFEKLESTNS